MKNREYTMLNKKFILNKCLYFILLQNIYRKGLMLMSLTALAPLTVAGFALSVGLCLLIVIWWVAINTTAEGKGETKSDQNCSRQSVTEKIPLKNISPNHRLCRCWALEEGGFLIFYNYRNQLHPGGLADLKKKCYINPGLHYNR